MTECNVTDFREGGILRCNGNGNRSEEPLGNFETKLHETG